jgi:hypothetical protein
MPMVSASTISPAIVIRVIVSSCLHVYIDPEGPRIGEELEVG